MWMTDDTSSNYKKATNLVLYLKNLLQEDDIKQGLKMYLFIDNEVAEKTYFRGLSHSSKLHEMIVELEKMEIDVALIIHFICIMGKCMLAQGIDGVFQADLSSGVMAGQRFLKYLSLNKTTHEKQESLKVNLLSLVAKG